MTNESFKVVKLPESTNKEADKLIDAMNTGHAGSVEPTEIQATVGDENELVFLGLPLQFDDVWDKEKLAGNITPDGHYLQNPFLNPGHGKPSDETLIRHLHSIAEKMQTDK